MVTNLITRTVPIPYDIICTKRGRKTPHSLLLYRMKKRITSVNIKNVSRLRNHQNENSMLFRDFVKQKFCSSRGDASISQEIVFEIVGLASAFVHLHNEISEGLFRVWVNEWVVVDNFRKATLFNTFLDDKLKVIFVGVGGSWNPTSAIWTSFRCAMIRTKWRFWIFLAVQMARLMKV